MPAIVLIACGILVLASTAQGSTQPELTLETPEDLRQMMLDPGNAFAQALPNYLMFPDSLDETCFHLVRVLDGESTLALHLRRAEGELPFLQSVSVTARAGGQSDTAWICELDLAGSEPVQLRIRECILAAADGASCLHWTALSGGASGPRADGAKAQDPRVTDGHTLTVPLQASTPEPIRFPHDPYPLMKRRLVHFQFLDCDGEPGPPPPGTSEVEITVALASNPDRNARVAIPLYHGDADSYYGWLTLTAAEKADRDCRIAFHEQIPDFFRRSLQFPCEILGYGGAPNTEAICRQIGQKYPWAGGACLALEAFCKAVPASAYEDDRWHLDHPIIDLMCLTNAQLLDLSEWLNGVDIMLSLQAELPDPCNGEDVLLSDVVHAPARGSEPISLVIPTCRLSPTGVSVIACSGAGVIHQANDDAAVGPDSSTPAAGIGTPSDMLPDHAMDLASYFRQVPLGQPAQCAAKEEWWCCYHPEGQYDGEAFRVCQRVEERELLYLDADERGGTWRLTWESSRAGECGVAESDLGAEVVRVSSPAECPVRYGDESAMLLGVYAYTLKPGLSLKVVGSLRSHGIEGAEASLELAVWGAPARGLHLSDLGGDRQSMVIGYDEVRAAWAQWASRMPIGDVLEQLSPLYQEMRRGAIDALSQSESWGWLGSLMGQAADVLPDVEDLRAPVPADVCMPITVYVQGSISAPGATCQGSVEARWGICLVSSDDPLSGDCRMPDPSDEPSITQFRSNSASSGGASSSPSPYPPAAAPAGAGNPYATGGTPYAVPPSPYGTGRQP